MRRIGFVAGAGGFENMAITNRTFFDALGESGYVHGKTMDVVFRTAEGDMAKMPSLVGDVLKSDVEILVVSSSPGCAAAKSATTSTPVLCISVQDDPIKAGLTSTLSHPQSNVIGVYSFLPTGISQQLQWVGKFVPKLETLGVLYNPKNATHVRLLTEWTSIATERGVRLVPMQVTRAEDLDAAITLAMAEKAQIGIGLLGPDTYAIRKDIAESARSRRFPIVMDTPGGYTDMGGVATVGVNIVPYYRRGAVELMIPMLQGKRPSDLSWIGPKQVDVIVNEQVARSFGLIVPAVPK
jgi:ABC-type uncharacterized transport system substrate-binding protein